MSCHCLSLSVAGERVAMYNRHIVLSWICHMALSCLLYPSRSHGLEYYTDRGRESDETSVLATDQGSGETLVNVF
jgi:hypothetical protein